MDFDQAWENGNERVDIEREQKNIGTNIKDKPVKIQKNKDANRCNTRKEKKYGNIATWNVRGLYYEGALKDLEAEAQKYNIEILALQETKHKGIFTTQLDKYILFNSGNDQRFFGTGFLISKNLKDSVEDFTAINERMCHLQLKWEGGYIHIINVHAPTEEKEEEEKDEFYEVLGDFYNKLPKNDMKLCIGDFNAKIGKEEEYTPTIGKFSKHDITNVNGRKLIGWAAGWGGKIMSTYFQHKEIHLGTWESPDGRTINQIDHIVVDDKLSCTVKDVRAFRGAEMDSDHRLVRVRIEYKAPPRKSRKIRKENQFKTEALQIKRMQVGYQEALQESDLDSANEKTINEQWNILENSVKNAAEKTIGRKQWSKKKGWFNDECKKSRQARQMAREKMLQTNKKEEIEKYKQEKKRTKAVYRRVKRAYKGEKLRNIQEHYKRKEIKNMYQEVNNVQRGRKQRGLFCKDKNGRIIGNDEESIEIWKDYFQKLLNEENESGEENKGEKRYRKDDKREVPPPSKEEIAEIIGNMKNGKSAGENGIVNELIKYGGQRVLDQIVKLCQKIWQQEEIPTAWKEAIIIPLHKKGDKAECSNYRGIALLDTTYKILATLIRNRIEYYAEGQIGEYQCGFRKERSTIDQIFTIKELQTMCYEHNIELYSIFIDFRRAYDSVKREKLYEAMEELGIPNKLIRLVEITIRDSTNKVRVGNVTSKSFKTGVGLRQGDPLSTTLFNIILEKIIRASGLNRKGILSNKSHQILAYADDITLMARSVKELHAITKALEVAARQAGLMINEEKTSYMEMKRKGGDKSTKQVIINLEGDRVIKIKKVQSFIYLGACITEQAQEDAEIKARIIKGDRCAGTMNTILKAKDVSRKAKIQLYKTILRPTVTYGCETWALNKKEEETLEIWERKMLRKIFGGKKEGDIRLRRTNTEIKELYQEPTITQFIRAQRLRWAGHIERREDSRIIKKVIHTQIHSTRRQGRPKTRWMEAVLRDLREKGITNWREKAKNRKEWRKITQLWA